MRKSDGLVRWLSLVLDEGIGKQTINEKQLRNRIRKLLQTHDELDFSHINMQRVINKLALIALRRSKSLNK